MARAKDKKESVTVMEEPSALDRVISKELEPQETASEEDTDSFNKGHGGKYKLVNGKRVKVPVE